MEEHWEAITGTANYLHLFDTDNWKTQPDVMFVSIFLDFFDKTEKDWITLYLGHCWDEN